MIGALASLYMATISSITFSKKVYVEGKLQTRKWQDQSGADRYTTEIVGNDLTMLDSRNSDGSGGASQSPSTPAEDVNQEPQYSEDDIPF